MIPVDQLNYVTQEVDYNSQLSINESELENYIIRSAIP